MKKLKYKIPEMLIYSRLLIACLILILALSGTAPALGICGMLVLGVLTDIFDGIIARHLKVSNAHLRQLDTRIDRVFWLSSLFALLLLHPAFFDHYKWQLGILLLLELSAWIIGRIKFRAGISFHAILSKFWALSILVTMIDAFPDGLASLSFAVSFWYGLLAQLDSILIAFILPEFQCDIPSSWHALRIRRGQPIRRMKLFNG